MIKLERSIEIRTFDVEGEIAVSQDRPEFLAVARLAADLDQPIDGAVVTGELLGGLPPQVGWRVIERCLQIGLLERERPSGPARLSDSGRLMLERNAVLVPQEGIWRLFYVDDALVPQRVIHADRLERRDAQVELNELKAARDRGVRTGSGVATPRQVDTDQVLFSFTGDGSFQIRALGKRGEPGPRGDLKLELRWEPDGAPLIRALGRLSLPPRGGKNEQPRSAPVDFVVDPVPALEELGYDGLWTELVAHAKHLDASTLRRVVARAGRVLPTTMEQWPEPVRRAMKSHVDVPSIDLAEIGRFEKTRLDAVDLVPIREEDAQRWAEWLIWDGVDRYMVPADLEELSLQVIDRFHYHSPTPLEPSAWLARALRSPKERASRFILATHDLGLWR